MFIKSLWFCLSCRQRVLLPPSSSPFPRDWVWISPGHCDLSQTAPPALFPAGFFTPLLYSSHLVSWVLFSYLSLHIFAKENFPLSFPSFVIVLLLFWYLPDAPRQGYFLWDLHSYYIIIFAPDVLSVWVERTLFRHLRILCRWHSAWPCSPFLAEVS